MFQDDVRSTDPWVQLSALKEAGAREVPLTAAEFAAAVEALCLSVGSTREENVLKAFRAMGVANVCHTASLLEQLRTSDSRSACKAALVLSALGAPEAVPLIISRLQSDVPSSTRYEGIRREGTVQIGRYDDDYRSGYLFALQVGADERAFPVLKQAVFGRLPKSGYKIRTDAARALGELRTAEALDVLRTVACGDENGDVRGMARYMLERTAESQTSEAHAEGVVQVPRNVLGEEVAPLKKARWWQLWKR